MSYTFTLMSEIFDTPAKFNYWMFHLSRYVLSHEVYSREDFFLKVRNNIAYGVYDALLLTYNNNMLLGVCAFKKTPYEKSILFLHTCISFSKRHTTLESFLTRTCNILQTNTPTVVVSEEFWVDIYSYAYKNNWYISEYIGSLYPRILIIN